MARGDVMEAECKTEGCSGRIEFSASGHAMGGQRIHTHAKCPECRVVWSRFEDDGSVVRAPEWDQENLADG
jgi:hypothetical protein